MFPCVSFRLVTNRLMSSTAPIPGALHRPRSSNGSDIPPTSEIVSRSAPELESRGLAPRAYDPPSTSSAPQNFALRFFATDARRKPFPEKGGEGKSVWNCEDSIR